MRSKVRDVTTYIINKPEDRRSELETLRSLCRKILDGFEESMEYGMPCYKRHGIVEVAFASKKNYISLYILQQRVMKENAAALKPFKPGKGCIKFSPSKRIDTELVRKLLKDTSNFEGTICGPRP